MLVILLIEDNQDDIVLIRRAFYKTGLNYSLEVYTDGAVAIERLTNREKPIPDLILLDLALPRIDGITILEYIRATRRLARVPVVIITGNGIPDGMKLTPLLGYVKKTMDYALFVSQVRDTILQHIAQER